MAGAMRLGDKAQVPLDAHGCPACPHPGIGPAIAGSPDVNVNKRPAIRLDDPGIHMACCGPNQWTAMQGSITVFVNGKPAVRMGDQTRHCGGLGKVVEGSPNVIVGGPPGMANSGGGGGGGAPGGAGAGDARASSSAARSGAGGPGAGGASSTGASSMGASSTGASSTGASSTGASSAGASSAGASSSADAAHEEPDPNVYVVAADLTSPGGQALGFERVVLVKKGSDEQVAGPEITDERGHVAFVVAEQGDYELRVVEDEHPYPQEHIDERDVTFGLACAFFDDGVPVEGEAVHVRGNGVNQRVTLGVDGQLALTVGAGEYELTIRKQSFAVHAVRAADRVAPDELQLDNALDASADFEAARAHRGSPTNRGWVSWPKT